MIEEKETKQKFGLKGYELKFENDMKKQKTNQNKI